MKKRRFMSLLFLLSLLLAWQSTPAQQNDKFSRLEQTVLAELKTRGIPGAAVVVVHGDRIVFQKGFGVANVETKEPVSPDMLFKISSATKMFTSAALVTLSEEGKIDLNAPVGRYISGLTPKLSQITVHQLLSHTAGLKQGPPPASTFWTMPLRDIGRGFTDEYSFVEPGRVFSYSNAGFALAGAVIETISGKPYADYVAERLFKPLAMNRTTYDASIAMTYPFSQGLHSAGGSEQIIKRFSPTPAMMQPGFGIISSVQDLSRFATAFVNAGRLGGTQVLSASLVRKLSTPYTAFNQAKGDYGYGLRVYEHRGVRVVEHGGQGPGFGSLIYMVPKRHFAIIILANRTASGRLYNVVDAALDVVLRLPPAPTEAGESLPMTSAEMAGYAGKYLNSTAVELSLMDGKLFYRENDLALPVTKVGERSFNAGTPGAAGAVSFVLVPGISGKSEFLYKSMVAYRKVTGK